MRKTLTSLATAAALVCGGFLLATPPARAATPTDLLISEYVEGTSNNKAVELANPTAAPIDLAAGQYALRFYFNGATTPGLTIPLTGTVAAGDVFVAAHASAVPAVLAQADLTNSSGWFNGDDAVVLVKGTDVIDSLGQVGVDPGTEWGSGLTSTADNTLRRQADICAGDTDPTDAFDPAAQWDGYAVDTFDGLGAHTASCGSDPEPTPTPTASPTPSPTPTPTTTPTPTPVTPIGTVQGSGEASPIVNSTVTIEGVVTGDFQVGGFNGYYVQDAGDGEAATSDAVFVHAPNGAEVSVGDRVRVTGRVAEFYGLTQVVAAQVTVLASGQALPQPVAVTVPLTQQESREGMLVTFAQPLVIVEYYNFARYGEIVLGTTRQDTPTAVADPGAPAQAVAASNAQNRVTLDDGRSVQNADPAIHPNGREFTLDNYFRGGDTLTGVTGILDYRNNAWKIQPTTGAQYEATNPRPAVPAVGGTLQVASYNVLNYFTTLGSRGADTAEEFERQEAKIVAGMIALDAEVYGLLEIENNGTALDTLVAALNEKAGAGTYAAVTTGAIGLDEIAPALVYRPAAVTPVGTFAFKVYDDLNRPTLVQTFEEKATGARFNVAVNHLKSKGSACVDDPDTGDGQGNCNLTRLNAARQMAEWLASDPTGQNSTNTLIVGDLNSYDHEDPIKALVAAGYTDLEKKYGGEQAYSYVFDGQKGYLDYPLSSESLTPQVTGAGAWHINADEVSLLDYDMSFKQPAQDALYAPDPYRSSDHDPVLVGLNLKGVDRTPPTLSVRLLPSNLYWNSKLLLPIVASVRAADDQPGVTWRLVSVTSSEPDFGGKDRTRGDIVILDRHLVLVRDERVAAVRTYTFTYEAKDAASNITTTRATVTVRRP